MAASLVERIRKAAATALTWAKVKLIAASDALADAAFRAAQRRRLMELSDLGLRDIGISRADAWAEYRKPFWRR